MLLSPSRFWGLPWEQAAERTLPPDSLLHLRPPPTTPGCTHWSRILDGTLKEALPVILHHGTLSPSPLHVVGRAISHLSGIFISLINMDMPGGRNWVSLLGKITCTAQCRCRSPTPAGECAIVTNLCRESKTRVHPSAAQDLEQNHSAEPSASTTSAGVHTQGSYQACRCRACPTPAP